MINPFFEEYQQNIKIKKVTSKQKVKDSPSNLDLADPSTGEVYTLTVERAFSKVVDPQQFLKVYPEASSKIMTLGPPGLAMLMYIAETLKPGKDQVIIDPVEAMSYGNYATKRSVYKGLSQLTEGGVIMKVAGNHSTYWINPAVIFNGSRVPLTIKYLKEKGVDVFE